jgi:hypothetical protein
VCASGLVVYENGNINSEDIEQELAKMLRSKWLLKQMEEDELEYIVNNLTDEDEEKLKEEHARNYMGTDDDMPDAYESWCSDLTVEDYKRICL